MSSLLRLILFLVGAVVVGPVLLIAEQRFDHIWLPIALGCLYAAAFVFLGNAPPPRFAVPHCVGVLASVVALWAFSIHGERLFQSSNFAVHFKAVAVVGAAGLAIAFLLTPSLPRNDRRSGLWWTALALMFCAVAYASSSAGGTDPFYRFFEQRLGLSHSQAEIAVVGVRKGVHFVFYGLVAWCAAAAALGMKASRSSALSYGLYAAAVLAAFDEYRQTMALNRQGSTWDLLLDLAGAVTFLCILGSLKGVRS